MVVKRVSTWCGWLKLAPFFLTIDGRDLVLHQLGIVPQVRVEYGQALSPFGGHIFQADLQQELNNLRVKLSRTTAVEVNGIRARQVEERLTKL